MIRRLAAALAVILTLAAGSAAGAQTGGLKKITITVPSVEASDAAYFVAVRKGYFKAENIDANLLFAGGGVAVPALISGTVEGSASGTAAISAMLRGAALKLLMVFCASPTYKVWGTADIKSLADLKGKSVGVATRGDTYEIATRLALQANGIAPNDVGYTPLGFGSGIGAAIESGALPAVTLSTSAAIAMQDDGQLKKAHVVYDIYGHIRMPWNGFAMSDKFMKDDPATAHAIVRALVKASRYMRAFKPETIAIVATYQKEPHLHAIGIDYDEFMKAMTPDLMVGPDLQKSDLEVRAALNGVPAAQIPPLENIYDFSLMRGVSAELDKTHWKPTR